MESKKRKREDNPPRVTFIAPGKTFERLLKETSLSETKDTIRKKLGLTSSAPLNLTQVRDNHFIDLDDDDDFEAFCVAAKSTGLAEVRVTFQGRVLQQTSHITEQPSVVASAVGKEPRKKKRKTRENNGAAVDVESVSTNERSVAALELTNESISTALGAKPVSARSYSTKSTKESGLMNRDNVVASASGAPVHSAKQKQRVHFGDNSEPPPLSKAKKRDNQPNDNTAKDSDRTSEQGRKRKRHDKQLSTNDHATESPRQIDPSSSIASKVTPGSAISNGIGLSNSALGRTGKKKLKKGKQTDLSTPSIALPDTGRTDPPAPLPPVETASHAPAAKKEKQKKQKPEVAASTDASSTRSEPFLNGATASSSTTPIEGSRSALTEASTAGSASEPLSKKKQKKQLEANQGTATGPSAEVTSSAVVTNAVQQALSKVFSQNASKGTNKPKEQHTSKLPEKPKNSAANGSSTTSDLGASALPVSAPASGGQDEPEKVEESASATTKKAAKSGRGCVICHAEDKHTGYHCPVVKAGPSSIQKRLEEAKKGPQTSENKKFIIRLELWLSRSLKDSKKKHGKKGVDTPITSGGTSGPSLGSANPQPNGIVQSKDYTRKSPEDPLQKDAPALPPNVHKPSDSAPKGGKGDKNDESSDSESSDDGSSDSDQPISKVKPLQVNASANVKKPAPRLSNVVDALFVTTPVATPITIPKNLEELFDPPPTKKRILAKDIVTPQDSENETEREAPESESEEEEKRPKASQASLRRRSSTPPVDEDDDEDDESGTPNNKPLHSGNATAGIAEIQQPELPSDTRAEKVARSEAGPPFTASQSGGSDYLPTFKAIHERGETASVSYSGDEAVESAMADDNAVFLHAMKEVGDGKPVTRGRGDSSSGTKSVSETETESDTEIRVRRSTTSNSEMKVVNNDKEDGTPSAGLPSENLAGDVQDVKSEIVNSRSTSTTSKDVYARIVREVPSEETAGPVVLVPATQSSQVDPRGHKSSTPVQDVESQEQDQLEGHDDGPTCPATPMRVIPFKPGTPGTARRMKDRFGRLPLESPQQETHPFHKDTSDDAGEDALEDTLMYVPSSPITLRKQPESESRSGSKERDAQASRRDSPANSIAAVSDAVQKVSDDGDNSERVPGPTYKKRPVILVPSTESLKADAAKPKPKTRAARQRGVSVPKDTGKIGPPRRSTRQTKTAPPVELTKSSNADVDAIGVQFQSQEHLAPNKRADSPAALVEHLNGDGHEDVSTVKVQTQDVIPETPIDDDMDVDSPQQEGKDANKAATNSAAGDDDSDSDSSSSEESEEEYQLEESTPIPVVPVAVPIPIPAPTPRSSLSAFKSFQDIVRRPGLFLPASSQSSAVNSPIVGFTDDGLKTGTESNRDADSDSESSSSSSSDEDNNSIVPKEKRAGKGVANVKRKPSFLEIFSQTRY